MSLDEKIGQLLMVPYYGGFASTDSEEFLRLARQVRELHVGGLIVSTRPQRPTGFERSEVYGLAEMTNRLQQLAPVPVLVAADFERGAGFRVRDTTSFPHNMTLGAAGDPELAYPMGRTAASAARPPHPHHQHPLLRGSPRRGGATGGGLHPRLPGGGSALHGQALPRARGHIARSAPGAGPGHPGPPPPPPPGGGPRPRGPALASSRSSLSRLRPLSRPASPPS